MESIESYNNISLKPLTGLSLGPQPGSPRQADKIRNKMSKISSADSLLSMIRNLASSKMSISSPSSPQLSDNGDMASSGRTTNLYSLCYMVRIETAVKQKPDTLLYIFH